MLGDFASLDVQNTYRGSDAYGIILLVITYYLPIIRFYRGGLHMYHFHSLQPPSPSCL
ncbi:hypothetical protein ACR9PT_04705 [Piscirickettsia salmonis]|uniref:hypothetical protein n=1 Tax=Piscirickettsia salmonis TaxID=1238 RepID=UPI003EBBF756